jgi:hypothetical protein
VNQITPRGPGRPRKHPEQDASPNPPEAEVASSEPEAALSQRAIEVRSERRRRDPGDIDRLARQRLAIPSDIKADLDAKGLTARWAVDQPGRIKQLMAEDWDIVPGAERVSASRDSGDEHILMCKRKDWYDDDRRPLREINQETQKRATQQRGEKGENASFADADGGHTAEQFYGPRHTQNRIGLATGKQIGGA